MPLAHADPDPVAALRRWISEHKRIFVLTGAGCSTASGIPDYRDGNGAWKRPPPVTWQAFTGDPAVYRRYWVRSSVGWPRFMQAQPNAAHSALARLEGADKLSILVTQNVDGLHQRAGSRAVVDLHGRLDEVTCLACAARSPRATVQADMLQRNPVWEAAISGLAPDGDADIDDAAIAGFVPPLCAECDGPLKPDVVFFGENVPRERFVHAQHALQGSDAMLVVGSSLMVYSGFRFARMAVEAGLPLAILNRGHTRGDALATLKIEADASETLDAAVVALA
jgi:NAD-dependent SIR2 family protein deacetylase